ncbi:SGNH/GDSL hydrolase family protein [Sphingomonas sp. H39-1-10]|uniref:SGNH/GDSL hydrolase family protein n=1 Tax=Sphingomonas TaxID=13687 RepID=UPI000886D010|nr:MULTISPECIES: SGNH/GDSL hydrolase family protein [Sphingomonas]MDF0487317.1 SGNH/GDSL hydrolase family protein [Sphingomonas pollutisoli]SDA15424.1 Lysophospholipase L1 [Sphingomonas sp. NFR15]
MNRIKSLLALGAAGLAVAAAAAPPAWIGAYGNAPIGYEPAIRDALGGPLRDQTVRQVVRVGAASDRLRIRLTNELGATPLRIGAATFARLDASGTAIPASIRPLTFNGAPGTVIPAGAPVLADALAAPVTPGTDYAVSIYFPETSTPPAHAQMADVAPGDQTARATLSGSVRKRVPAIVSRIDVAARRDARVLLAFGDSITEGAASTPGAYQSWPDQLARLLATDRRGRCWSVVNAGVSGNRLLHDGRGPNAVARFDRDVLAVPGVRTLVLLEGINDIGASAQAEHRDQAVGAEAIIQAYREIVARARAHHIRVIGGTLLPFKGAVYFTAEGEAKRQAVNAWIRSPGAFDAVIDFDAAMRDPAHPAHMAPAADSTDNLHPRDAGYAIMAKAAAAALARDPCPGA